MAYWKSRGLRGSTFEEIINHTNEIYQKKKLGLINKVPTPIKPIQLDSETRRITLAYFEQKSTVDYIGVVQGIPICFDVKETANKSLPLQNIHEHQVMYMEQFVEQKGVSFLLVYFQFTDECFLLPFETLKTYWDGIKLGKRKSIPYEEFNVKYKVANKQGAILHYFEALNLYLQDIKYKREQALE